jgi:hypothetical protein
MNPFEICANVVYHCRSGWPILARRAPACRSAYEADGPFSVAWGSAAIDTSLPRWPRR